MAHLWVVISFLPPFWLLTIHYHYHLPCLIWVYTVCPELKVVTVLLFTLTDLYRLSGDSANEAEGCRLHTSFSQSLLTDHFQSSQHTEHGLIQVCCKLYYHLNYVPHRRGGGHIVFGADPVGVGVSVSVGVTLSCLHNISWTGRWTLTKFS